MQSSAGTSGTSPTPPHAQPEIEPARESGPTAGSRAERAVAALSALDERDLSDHPAIYDRIHDELRSALAEVDQ